jgi:low temperature requirement protein LtrA
VTQVSTLLAQDLTWPGLARAMLVLALVWWAWSAFVWAANADDPGSGHVRPVLLVGTVLIFICALAIPEAYGRSSVVFTASYVCVRLLHLLHYWDVSRRGHASWTAIWGFGVTVIAGMALLIAGAIAGSPWIYPLWALAAAIDYAGPGWLTRKRLQGLQRVAVEHFAERYSLFVIICLGESIVAVGAGAAMHKLDAAFIGGAALMVLISIGLWWAYFDRLAEWAEARLRTHQDPVLAASDAYSYIHLVVVAGIIVFAAGELDSIGHIEGIVPFPAALASGGGIALYIAGLAAFRRRLGGGVTLASLVAIAGVAALTALASVVPGWLEAAGIVLVLAGWQAWERRTALAV